MKKLFEILVPATNNGEAIPLSHHKEWDKKVKAISKGMTIFSTAKGHWEKPDGSSFIEEPMIPVRMICSLQEMDEIALFTKKHYKQLAVMYYIISEQFFILE